MQQVSSAETTLTITARAISPTAVCPTCQQCSHRIHSYDSRSPQDLPVSGQVVHLVLHFRRFRCQNRQGQQHTFVERLPEVVPPYARRTTQQGATLSLFASALSGQAGSRLLTQIGMAVSADTLLRLAKQTGSTSIKSPKILGVDDFAFRRSRTYGTILSSTWKPIVPWMCSQSGRQRCSNASATFQEDSFELNETQQVFSVLHVSYRCALFQPQMICCWLFLGLPT